MKRYRFDVYDVLNIPHLITSLRTYKGNRIATSEPTKAIESLVGREYGQKSIST
jgi:hypothetical protein